MRGSPRFTTPGPAACSAATCSRSIRIGWAGARRCPATRRFTRIFRSLIASCAVTATPWRPLGFSSLCTPFEYAPDVGRDLALAAIDEALARAPGVQPYPLPRALEAAE
jgi:hypothetical protein